MKISGTENKRFKAQSDFIFCYSAVLCVVLDYGQPIISLIYEYELCLLRAFCVVFLSRVHGTFCGLEQNSVL